MSQKLIAVTGDPVLDVYLDGELIDGRFKIIRRTEVPGGADNTYQNIYHILDRPYYGVLRLSHVPYPKALVRFRDPANDFYMESWQDEDRRKENFYNHNQGIARWPSEPILSFEAESHPEPMRQVHTLVISEYNKGTTSVGGYGDYIRKEPGSKICIVDSRYRTLDLSLIKNAEVKIWHCTDGEYDYDFSRNFDFVVWSNGPAPLFIGSTASSPSGWLMLEPKQADVVDVTGAGDTLVAAIAAYLTEVEDVNLTSLRMATEFGLECCADVVSRDMTAVTNLKLKDYLP